ncbi:MAG: leucine-rich repeat protein [Oscillospiraceae bacterium]|nr:leucine-rich repeat protein [Oscillospiraceae bacterium]
MEQTYDVFISYRRKSGCTLARLLDEKLEAKGLHTFFDLEDMRAGNFNEQLYTYIEQSPSFLLILSNGALDRCIDEDDWLRKEIRHALRHQRNIVVVKDDNFEDYPQNLPDDIAEIRQYQSVRVSEEYFNAFFQRVTEYLKQKKAASVSPQPASPAISQILPENIQQIVPSEAAQAAPKEKPDAPAQPIQTAAKKRSTGLPPGTETVNVPADKTKIGAGEYACNSKLGTVILPEGITEIGSAAFANCTGLTAVQLPQSLTHIWTGAFTGCRNLREVQFPDGLKEIGAFAFTGCVSLSSITLPAAKIGMGAFAGCTGLENAVIPEDAKILPEAFAGCTRHLTIKQK